MVTKFKVITGSVDNLDSDIIKMAKNIKPVYLGYPENSQRTGDGPSNPQIAFLNTEGTRRRTDSRGIRKIKNSRGISYKEALEAYIRSHGDVRWHIPPRPFIQPVVEQNKEFIAQTFRDMMVETLDRRDIANLQRRLGLIMVTRVRQFMRDYPGNNLTPNAPSTIAEKGEDHPLKGLTGQLITRLTYVV